MKSTEFFIRSNRDRQANCGIYQITFLPCTSLFDNNQVICLHVQECQDDNLMKEKRRKQIIMIMTFRNTKLISTYASSAKECVELLQGPSHRTGAHLRLKKLSNKKKTLPGQVTVLPSECQANRAACLAKHFQSNETKNPSNFRATWVEIFQWSSHKKHRTSN